MDDCLFCRIVNGDINTEFVLENRDAVVFHDISPQAPVHLLVVPRIHVADIRSAPPELLGRLFQTANEAAALAGLDQFRYVVNTGASAGQSVFHLHVHLLGGRTLNWPPG
ncbi:MAG: HIT domain-containing protein [Acidobacteriota bacterium]|jgi:histidine triad (HIT) family protein|nr:HIT domain-containing protein [Acidobacteriota bacterium]